jgi:hypothetical protein
MMEKPRVPTKKELMPEKKTRGRKGVLKHFILRHDLDQLVSDYAKKLGISQAQVMEEMILVGVSRFEINHGFRIAEKRIDEKREAILTQQLNEKYSLILEQKKKDRARKAKDIEEAYSKRLAHGTDDDWQKAEW